MKYKGMKRGEYVCSKCGADWDPNWDTCQRCGSITFVKKSTKAHKDDAKS